ncbi:MAG: carboxypeptidase-like regulatory domain-containing protein [Bacteroidota bacterium]|nr:carboxypeptidase-like regulatory domain-containing protein [Bacteroidota bacterium]
MKFVLIIFFSIPQLLFGQFIIKGKIVDARNNKVIPYANIWIKNANIGTTSSEKGIFSLTINKSTNSKSIIISSIGFYDTIIQIKDLKPVIKLSPKDYEIPKIVVSPRKKEELILNDLSKEKINGGIMNDTTPQIIGRYFPYKLKNSSFRHIKSVIIYSRDSQKGIVNIRIYSFDTSKAAPINELVHSNIIFETKISLFGKAKPMEIDLSDYNLIFPKSGVLIGIEWLIIPRNRYKVTTNYTDTKTKKTRIMYAPNLGATINKKNNMYLYKEGRWIKPQKGHKLPGYKYSGLYFIPAISLKLSD